MSFCFFKFLLHLDPLKGFLLDFTYCSWCLGGVIGVSWRWIRRLGPWSGWRGWWVRQSALFFRPHRGSHREVWTSCCSAATGEVWTSCCTAATGEVWTSCCTAVTGEVWTPCSSSHRGSLNLSTSIHCHPCRAWRGSTWSRLVWSPLKCVIWPFAGHSDPIRWRAGLHQVEALSCYLQTSVPHKSNTQSCILGGLELTGCGPVACVVVAPLSYSCCIEPSGHSSQKQPVARLQQGVVWNVVSYCCECMLPILFNVSFVLFVFAGLLWQRLLVASAFAFEPNIANMNYATQKTCGT